MAPSLTVVEANDGDMFRIFEIGSLAFDRNEAMWDAHFPAHWTEEGRRAGTEHFLKAKREDPAATFIKAVDDSGQILGWAKWLLYKDYVPDTTKRIDVGNMDDPSNEKAWAAKMSEVFLTERLAAIQSAKGNIVSLDILAVDPAHQRKGVGAILVDWGLHKADEMGVVAVVESSPFGKGLYQKKGFQFVRDVSVDLPPPWQDRPVAKFAWLVRPKKD